MRKEQLKAFPEEQNKILDEHKENLDPEIGLFLEAYGNCKGFINKYNESEESVASQAEAGDPAGHAFNAQSTFLLPAVLESRSLTKSLNRTFVSEVINSSVVGNMSNKVNVNLSYLLVNLKLYFLQCMLLSLFIISLPLSGNFS